MSTNGAQSASPPNDGHMSDAYTGSKRKNPDGSESTQQQRAKRNRYISIACNECKRCAHLHLHIHRLVLTPCQAQDQVQWPDAVPALRQPPARVSVCAQLLQQLQGLRVRPLCPRLALRPD